MRAMMVWALSSSRLPVGSSARKCRIICKGFWQWLHAAVRLHSAEAVDARLGRLVQPIREIQRRVGDSITVYSQVCSCPSPRDRPDARIVLVGASFLSAWISRRHHLPRREAG